MVPFADYRMPLQYEGIVAEHHAVRTDAGLFDVSHMGRLRFEGPGALAFVDAHVAGAAWKLPVGKALYTVCCNEQGGIDDDLIVYRVAEARLLVVCNAASRERIVGMFRRSLAEGRLPIESTYTEADGKRRDVATELSVPAPSFEDDTEATALLALQGPRAVEVARRSGVPESVLALRPFRCAEVEWAGVPALFARTGYTGEDGFEALVPAEAAAELWDRWVAEGAKPCGLGARDTLRLEARLLLYGQDMDQQTDPFECGLGWTVALHRGEPPYRGREALLRRKEAGPRRRLVGFVLEERGIARPGHRLLDPDEPERQLGTVTSGAPSPTLRKSIGLGYVPAEKAGADVPLLVEVRGRRLRARTVDGPFYRRSKRA